MATLKRRPHRRARADRLAAVKCRHAARTYELIPGEWHGDRSVVIHLMICRTRPDMLRRALWLSPARDDLSQAMGMVRSWVKKVRTRIHGIERPARGWRGRIAVVLLNEVDVMARPSELISHEATHAAMRYCDWYGVSPSGSMEREEFLAHTVGVLVKQMNRIFYAHAYRRPT